jgi:4-amino-4-deoxy-L-arabinose transferase-like glycosyltransferase
MTSKGPLAWLKTPAQLHVRIYSIPAALFGSRVNSLTAEPVNIIYYVAILCLTFQIGKLVFDRRVGLIASGVLAVWPSFVIHTTQILKDPLFFATFLTLILIITVWLTKQVSWLKGLATAVAGVSSIYLISLTRSGFWGAIMLAILIVGLCLILIRQLREKKFLPINMASAVLVALASVILNHQAPEEFESNQARMVATAGAATQRAASPQRINLPAIRLSELRQGWLQFNKDAGSNIDSDVEFATMGDVVRYLPRAWAIGFLAPFPNYWFASGKQVGLTGRLFSGCEMLLTYIAELLALFGLWRARSNLSAWLLAGSIIMGITALALGVINLGSLYRFRYVFLILMIILAVHGLVGLLAFFKPEILTEMKESTGS